MERRSLPRSERPRGESLGADFWAEATLEPHRKPRSEGHLTRMQNVLKAYVKARQADKRRA